MKNGKKICTPPLHSGIPEKNLTGWVEDMEFPGTSKKKHVNFPGVTKNNKKLCGISSGLGFWSLEFLRDITQFCPISRSVEL